jgi:heme-degrading monooxygenase HmoA
MAVYSIWESHFPPDAAEEGRLATQSIWIDMVGFDGYVGHELLEDLDDPGHLVVISRWTSRERADQALRDYSDNPKAAAVNRIVSEPRRRIVARPVHTQRAPSDVHP